MVDSMMRMLLVKAVSDVLLSSVTFSQFWYSTVSRKTSRDTARASELLASLPYGTFGADNASDQRGKNKPKTQRA